jgi:preprotein translocase subunit SecD
VPAPTTTTSRPGRLLATLVALIIILILGVLAGSAFSPGSWHKRFKVGLGLDLSSGTDVTLQARPPKGISQSELQANMNTAVGIMNSRVNGAGFNGATVVPQGTQLINVTVPGKNAQQVVGLVGTTAQLRFRPVLLMAPNRVTPQAQPAAPPAPAPSPSAKGKAQATPKPSRSSAGGGKGQSASAQRLAGAAAAPVASKPKASAAPSPSPSSATTPSSPASATPRLATTADGTGDAALLSPAVRAQFDAVNCDNKNWRSQIYGSGDPSRWDNPNIQTVVCYQGAKYALDKSTVTGEMLKFGGSSAQLQNSGNYWVNLAFNGQGTKSFGALSTRLYDNYYDPTTMQPKSQLDYFAIVLDGEAVSIPYMAGALTTGTATIEGTFTQGQADDLANQLNYGALPLSFTDQQTRSISAQLGSSQLHAGLLAGLVGLILVVLYAFLYYRGLGIVAVASLAIAALLSYLAVVLLSLYESFAMSLAGIAGLIVAIGITADSFVVYFERLRDEVRDGKSLRTAVERGWQRARRTILVSDTVSFIAAAVLYKFAVSDVQNFAFTLGLTTLVDVVVVFLFTKPMITLLARTKFYGGGHRLSGLDPARLGARSPWRGSRRPAARPQASGAQASRAPGGASPAVQPRTNPREA